MSTPLTERYSNVSQIGNVTTVSRIRGNPSLGLSAIVGQNQSERLMSKNCRNILMSTFMAIAVLLNAREITILVMI